MNALAVALPASPGMRRRMRSWLMGAELGELPSHVQRELDSQRQKNEILAGWIQASLVLVFAVFYTLSRKTFAEDTILRPVP